MIKLPYLLVAEQSVIKIIDITVSGLEKHANADGIYVVVPSSQIELFRPVFKNRVFLLAEEDVLPEWPLSNIKLMLSKYPWRAGWYLQQFLKLSFGQYSGVKRYVIWDADTVMLKSLELEKDFRIVMNTNIKNQIHQPYFNTYKRLFGLDPTLTRSMISQYMLIDSQICLQMQQEICNHRNGDDWIEILLSGLPEVSISEFSEYETYANYLAQLNPNVIDSRATKWFLYGAEIFPNFDMLSLEMIEKRFSGYSYVAFERHPFSMFRRVGSRIQLLFGV